MKEVKHELTALLKQVWAHPFAEGCVAGVAVAVAVVSAHRVVVSGEIRFGGLLIAVFHKGHGGGQTGLQGIVFRRVSEGETKHRIGVGRQSQLSGGFFDAVAKAADEASAETEGLKGDHGVLHHDAGVERGGEKLFRPTEVGIWAEEAVAMEIRTEDPEFRRGFDMGLMARADGHDFTKIGIRDTDDARQLEVAGRGCPEGCLQNEGAVFGADGFVGKAAHGRMSELGAKRGIHNDLAKEIYDKNAKTV